MKVGGIVVVLRDCSKRRWYWGKGESRFRLGRCEEAEYSSEGVEYPRPSSKVGLDSSDDLYTDDSWCKAQMMIRGGEQNDGNSEEKRG